MEFDVPAPALGQPEGNHQRPHDAQEAVVQTQQNLEAASSLGPVEITLKTWNIKWVKRKK